MNHTTPQRCLWHLPRTPWTWRLSSQITVAMRLEPLPQRDITLAPQTGVSSLWELHMEISAQALLPTTMFHRR